MSSVETGNTFTFQTEIRQLLHILSHSLYQNREIALRELFSNASDALNKLRHRQLTDASFPKVESLQISVVPEKEGRTLTIQDNGIGMSREELIENLGTIAQSGSRKFAQGLAEAEKGDLSLIGQFGVGFYASFMLADRVEVLSRPHSQNDGWRWESTGAGSFDVTPANDIPAGTQIRLHLKADADEFLEPERLKNIVRRYSSFIPFPIVHQGEQWNAQRPIWVEPKSQLTDEDYTQFYQFLTHRTFEKPIWKLHLSLDSPLQFHAVLLCPPTNLEKLGFGRMEHGLSLCAKRILVQDDNKDLLPDYLHFLNGLVDSADLPLNVSRETLQDNSLIPKLRKVITRRTLDFLDDFARENSVEYLKFYGEFGSILRMGIGSDPDHRDRVAKLIRIPSTFSDDKEAVTSLADYVSRMPEAQKKIYYLGIPDRASAAANPHLEAIRKRKLEVLLLVDPVDEFVLNRLGEFDGKELISIDADQLELPDVSEEATGESPDSNSANSSMPEVGFSRVLDLFRQALGDKVTDVRESKRLTDSPVCLVSPQGGMSGQLQRALSQNMKDFELARRILEVNPKSALIKRLCALTANMAQEEFIRDCGKQLFSNALLMDGLVLDPLDTAQRMNRMLEELAQNRSPIIQ